MNISRELWQQIDPLLTDALEMEDGARESWLQGLDQTHPALSPALHKILAAHDRAARSRELETVPKLAPAPPPSSVFAAGARIGPFALFRLLGRGGMGEVWLAGQADGRVEREVALKLPMINLHSNIWRERFRRERDILARLTHPNIAKLFDAGVSEEDGSRSQPYLAMEYVEGVVLNEYVAAQKASIKEHLRLFRQILAAVAHAHRHLVVHRDLKPANILIDQSGQAKLLDFGIAKLIDGGPESNIAADLTQMVGRVMTLRYAAPEQVAGEVITTATDIYALGVILHELVTGHSPYRAAREGRPLTDAMLGKDATGVPSALAPAPIAKQIRGDLDAIILKAMRRNPADRYASIEQFDDDILRHLEDHPVKARAGTWRYLAGRFLARHTLPIAAAALVLLTIAAGVVMVEQQRRVAVVEKARAEKHFSSVRTLANSFMFDVHGEIENLAGSLKAREMLIKTSLQYLDSLANEAGDDPALRAELAVAYSKVANVQGSTGGPNLGMLSDSLANFEKSKALFAALGDYRADDTGVQREHMKLRYALARAYAQRGDPRWQENIAASVMLAERVAAMKGASARDRSDAPSMLAEQASLSTIIKGHSLEAEAQIDKAVSTLEGLLREIPGEVVVQDILASAYERGAGVFAEGQRRSPSLTRAIEMRRKALALLAKLVQEHPDAQRYPKVLAGNQVSLARDLEKAGRYAEGDETIVQALKAQKALVVADPNNAGELAEILGTHGLAVRIAYRQGDHAKAIRRGRVGQSHFAATPDELKKTLSTRNDLSEATTYLGLALMATSAKAGTAPDRQVTRLKEACALLADSVAFVDEVRAAMPGAGDEEDVRERRDGLARCRAHMAKLGRQ